jgi:hypothetical protein
LDALIEKLPKRSGAICDGNGTSWSFECFGIFGKSTQDIFGGDGKDYDQEYFDGDVKYHLGLTADKVNQCR